MKFRLSILLLAFVASISGASCDNAIAEAVSRIDWQSAPLELADPKGNPLLYITVEFERAGTWKKQKDEWALSVRAPRKAGDPIRSYWGYGKGWGGSDGNSGTGVARPGNFRKDGFDVVFSLAWSLQSTGDGVFKDTIPCEWVPEQTFDKAGFHITVTIRPAPTK